MEELIEQGDAVTNEYYLETRKRTHANLINRAWRLDDIVEIQSTHLNS